MKIIIASDSHGRNEKLDEIYENYKEEADLFLHCGDLESDPDYLPQWTAVAGNMDAHRRDQLDSCKIIEAGNHKILMQHGHRYYAGTREEQIAAEAKENGCDIALYGHTHIPFDAVIDGVRIINPGSLSRPKKMSAPGFVVMDLDVDEIKTERVVKK